MPALDYHVRRGKDDLPDLMRLLGVVGEPPSDVLQAGAEEFRLVLVESYPPVQLPRPPFPWVSEKQRHYVMMMIRQGKITVPYPRTGKLGRGWDVGAEAPDRWHVRSITPYATYVQGGRQNPYHARLGWDKIPVVYRKNAERVRARMRKELFRRWSKHQL